MNIQGDNDLFTFLTSAPKEFKESERIRKHQLKNGDFVHCVLWKNHFYITGTDIVKILIWRFQNAGRTIGGLKKFEEGIFSDLRNLKPGVDATLENPRSEFLEFLYKNGCIRTQKKQKVFFWYSVPHDSLFCDALERDLRRESSINSYGKYIPENVSTYYQNNLNSQNPRKIYKSHRMGVRHVIPTYDSKSINMQSYMNNCGADKNIVKDLLFNSVHKKAHSEQPMTSKFSHGFIPPFSFEELGNQNMFDAQNNNFGIYDEYLEPKRLKKENGDGNEIMGQDKDIYPMPNIQGGFQK